MRQVLFRIPLHTSWTPDGIPIYGYGLMLFVAFIACTWLAGRLSRRQNIAKEHVQDLALWLFAGGIIGSRVVFMIQYGLPLSHFFYIWEGGLVFYGGMLGGAIGYLFAYWTILRKHGISTLKLADVIAPCAALGLCLGRIGCLLNGCCYGEVACPGCPAITFPLSGMPRQALVARGYQTAAGFTTTEGDETNDPRTRIAAVEPDSPADHAGLRAGDLITEVDGQTNEIIVEVQGAEKALQALAEELLKNGRRVVLEEGPSGRSVGRVFYDDPQEFDKDRPVIETVLMSNRIAYYDTLMDRLHVRPPRGKNELALTVLRGEQTIVLPAFEPRTLGLHPTQVYETISTGLLCLFLLAYYPCRRHDGELLAWFLILYPIHRFLNEMLRDDTEPVALGLTLSQNGSILVFVVGLVLLLWLRRLPAPYEPWKRQAQPA
jgi:prolipoprotein diacylglyceryltransferase